MATKATLSHSILSAKRTSTEVVLPRRFWPFLFVGLGERAGLEVRIRGRRRITRRIGRRRRFDSCRAHQNSYSKSAYADAWFGYLP